MDEAERCHKLAILEDGIKRADDAPANLMANMAATVVEIEVDNIRQLKLEVLQLSEVISAAQLGSRLRVLIKDTVENPATFLQQHTNLSKDDIFIVRPSLEDVFITCTGDSRQ